VAMGIGRFAFTPILPMMQDDAGLSVAAGGWLASANYVGYLIGALTVVRGAIRPTVAIRTGLVLIAVATLAMGFDSRFVVWIALRALAGVASAWVLVNVSAWALEQLARQDRAELGGIVYAGVGAGIVLAGAVCGLLLYQQATSAVAWVVLGIVALVMTAALWSRVVPNASTRAADQQSNHTTIAQVPQFWRLVLCNGAFGLGYIIPATFLPVMARQVVSDPRVFVWAWPLFGAAAAISTPLAAHAARAIGQRNVWIIGNLVMALGVLVPIVLPGIAGIVIAALAVGGTFMVVTMAGFQEARRIAGRHARMLMAAMTSAFALGQIVGPLLVSALATVPGGLTYALVIAAIPLCIAAIALLKDG